MRDIPGYEGRYQVNEAGEIYSLLSHRLLRAYYSKPSGRRGPYLTVSLNGKTTRVHNVVLRTFVGPRPSRMVGRHLDGDVRNNRLSNLAYGTHADNAADAKQHDRYAKGERHWKAVLTDEIVREVRRLRGGGLTIIRIAEILNINKRTVGYVVKGSTWSHVQ